MHLGTFAGQNSVIEMYDEKRRVPSEPPKPRPPSRMRHVSGGEPSGGRSSGGGLSGHEPSDRGSDAPPLYERSAHQREQRDMPYADDGDARVTSERAVRPSDLLHMHMHAEYDHDLPVAHETSAGGVIVKVENGQAYIAVIARRNRAGHIEWCLPKGHIEGSETAVEAAVREVCEETGILGRALKHLATIDYWFSGRHYRIHKVVHHYLLEALSGTITVENDPDHEAEKAEWVPIAQVSSRLAYPNERKIVALAYALLKGHRA